MSFKEAVIRSSIILLFSSSLLYSDSDISIIEGPDGVASHLQENDDAEGLVPNLSVMQSYDDWKEELKENTGLSFDLQANILYQQTGDVLEGRKDNASGGIYRFSGTWLAFEEENGNTGRIEWRVENRSSLGSLQSPSNLSAAIGIRTVNSAFTYTDTFDTDIAVLNWTQEFQGRGGFAIGRLAFDIYLDAFIFQTAYKGFVNRSFIYNPTMPTTGVGALGAVAKAFITDNILIGAQIYDANAVSGKFDMDTFKQHEWLKAVEIAWTPSIGQYKVDRIQFTYWQKDERKIENIGKGSGWAVSASHQFSEQLIPFLRFGHSTGDASVMAKNSASMGFEYSLDETHTWSFGAGWAEPFKKTVEENIKDEYVFEASYKIQVSPNLSFMPDVQYLINPANNLNVDSTWILGLQCIISL